jgi:hypothetical protein
MGMSSRRDAATDLGCDLPPRGGQIDARLSGSFPNGCVHFPKNFQNPAGSNSACSH